MVEALAQALDDARGSGEVHIGDPEGYQVVTPEFGVHLLKFSSAGVVAVDDTVKIVPFDFHRSQRYGFFR